VWRRFLLGVVLWGVVSAIWLEGEASPETPLALTVGLALLFGVVLTVGSVLAWVVWRGATHPAPTEALPEGERLIATALANHFSGWEGRGGRLFVTDVGLRFVPHGFNYDLSTATVPISSVVSGTALNERMLRIEADRPHTFVVPEAEMVSLWLRDVIRGDRSLEAVLDIDGFEAVPAGRRRLRFRARPTDG